jgi:hypothetical protein
MNARVTTGWGKPVRESMIRCTSMREVFEHFRAFGGHERFRGSRRHELSETDAPWPVQWPA